MFKKKNGVILLLGILLGVVLSTGGSIFAKQDGKIVALPYEELRMFTEVFGRIKRYYVEPISDKKLLEDAIKGMLAGLDPHSVYLDNEQYKALKEGTTGQFGGLGIEVTMENGFIKVISPIDDTPAQRAGMQAGDLIVRLDKKPVKGMSLTDAVKIMRGKPGSDILLTVVREKEDLPLQITITRAIINVKSVKAMMLEKDYAYIRISNFQSRTSQSVVDELHKLASKNNGDLKGLVLDLRNNPGGILSAAVEVSDTFLEQGLIVYTEGRIKNSQMKFNATLGDIVSGIPIVVLINAGSASASEIVAGALQYHNRAIIMGEKSFGKGSVQTVLPAGNGVAIKLTTARYYTPSGRSIQAEGIEPDIALARIKLESLGELDYKPIKEVDLSQHLQNGGNANQDDDEKVSQPSPKPQDSNLGLRDYALHQALTLLKGLNIFNQ